MSFQNYRPSGFSILPPVVKNLLIINGIFFVATIIFKFKLNIDLADYLGLHYFLSEEFRPHQIITYMFMHGGFAHILLNMFGLWMFGNSLENYWGGKRFLIFYVVCGIGAAITHYTIFYFQSAHVVSLIDAYIQSPNINDFENLFRQLPKFPPNEVSDPLRELFNRLQETHSTQESQDISIEFLNQFKIDYFNLPVIVGASGAIFGILLAFGMTFPDTPLIMIFFPVPIKAKYFVILYGAIELISGIRSSEGDNVAHFAHLGGMLFGFVLIQIWKKRRTNF